MLELGPAAASTGREEAPASVIPLAIRFSLYTGALLAMYSSLPELVRDGDIVVFKEGGPVEWAQFLMLLATASNFAIGSVRFSASRRWFRLLAATASIACIRELDSTLDAALPWLGWQGPALLGLLVSFLVVWENPRQFLMQARAAAARRGFAILWTGFLAAVVFAQLVGHAPFLEALMGDDYTRDYKRVLEELGELFGYTLLLIGSVESSLEAAAADRSA